MLGKPAKRCGSTPIAQVSLCRSSSRRQQRPEPHSSSSHAEDGAQQAEVVSE
tara:strand:- start:336 stop:491 length:156 start_codon:yes stop_codon:yes gene_type:complete